MDRLRDLATQRRVDFHLRIPKSLSTTSLMPHKATDGDDGGDTNSAVSSTSANAVLEPTTCLTGNSHPAMPSLHLDKPPVHSLPSSDTKIAQSQSKAGNGMPFDTSLQTSSIKKPDKKPKMKGKTKGKTALKGTQAVIAQDNVIANSGLEVSRRMNECARDVLEANQIIKRKEHEIAAISTKIDSIKANFENASKHLQKAQAIAAEAIDNSVSEQFRRKEEANLVNILMGMTEAIAKGNSHNWSRAKVNKSLEDLELVYSRNKHYCQSPMVSSGIAHVAKHFMFHTDYEDQFQPMLFHLANQNDYSAFVERSRREDQQFATQHHVDYSTRPSTAPKPKTSKTTLNGEVLAENAKGKRNVDMPSFGELDGAADVARATFNKLKLEPTEKATALPPRSSSLSSSINPIPACVFPQTDVHQTPGAAAPPNPCGDAACSFKRFDELKTHDDLIEFANGLCSKPEPRPEVRPNLMAAAVLESIAGVEATYKDGMAECYPEVKKEVASAIKIMHQLNKEHVKSEEVAQKLSTVGEKHGYCFIQPSRVIDGRVRVEVTTSCCCPDCTSDMATRKESGHESKATHDEVTPQGETARGNEDVDLLWKAFVSDASNTER
ncbi:hypothetical protein J7T55_009435 [Diaporthe amygdali]|uniref:uncharacterized protein n=1 Tax=Phomopsis amygdali TaxID=1214568 RepID=UPI0022FE3C0F|nr:uncharacterized protein J7T55_009435 [Diaporthe amygdali]KAJ0104271.1 hypothetical protein J7T55_009435 [Diaporthe amygdali]